MRITWLAATRTALRVVAIAAFGTLGVGWAGELPGTPGPQRADRWVIQFAGGGFSLLSRSTTTKVLAGSDELPAVQLPPSGFWYELRSADGSVRYRRIIDDPVLLVFEGPALDLDQNVPTLAQSQRRDSTGARTQRGAGRAVDVRQSAAGVSRLADALDDPAPPIRDEAIPAQRVFSVLTPAAAEGDALILFSSPLAPNSQAEPATEVARFVVQTQIPQAQ